VNMRRKVFFAAVLAALFASATALAAAQEHEAPAEIGEHASAEHGGAEHEGAEGGHHELPALNWTDIFDKKRPAVIALFINFGLLAGLYYTLGKKPIAEALKQRRTTIAKDIDDARKRYAEAKERAKKYQGDLENADADANTAKTALISAGKGEVERQLADAKEKAERMKRDAARLVEQEQKQLQQDLHREAVERAVTEAMTVLERSVTADDHARFAQELLAELSKRPGASGAVSGGGAS
jgi:F0F1-type ATP synthase membrane subunit b/b'